MSTIDIEELFIQKFLEKYTLSERDLKKAFSKYDNNKLGLLDLNDIIQMFSSYLNGIKRSTIEEFIEKYDINGDGKISYTELVEFLTLSTKKKKTNNTISQQRNEYYSKENDATTNYRAVSSNSNNRPGDKSNTYNNNNNARDHDIQEDYSAPPSREYNNNNNYADNNNINTIFNTTSSNHKYQSNNTIQDKIGQNYDLPLASSSYPDTDLNLTLINDNNIPDQELLTSLKSYLSNLKQYLIKLVIQYNSKVPSTTATGNRGRGVSNNKGVDLLSLSSSQLLAVKVSEILLKEFQPYYTNTNNNKGQNYGSGSSGVVTFVDFAKVLRNTKLRIPGIVNLPQYLLQTLFNICESINIPGYADPTLLLHIMFSNNIESELGVRKGAGGGMGGASETRNAQQNRSQGLSLTRSRSTDNLNNNIQYTTATNSTNVQYNNSSSNNGLGNSSKVMPIPVGTANKLMEAVGSFIRGRCMYAILYIYL